LANGRFGFITAACSADPPLTLIHEPEQSLRHEMRIKDLSGID
jgi:hypothetical protein